MRYVSIMYSVRGGVFETTRLLSSECRATCVAFIDPISRVVKVDLWINGTAGKKCRCCLHWSDQAVVADAIFCWGKLLTRQRSQSNCMQRNAWRHCITLNMNAFIGQNHEYDVKRKRQKTNVVENFTKWWSLIAQSAAYLPSESIRMKSIIKSTVTKMCLLTQTHNKSLLKLLVGIISLLPFLLWGNYIIS